MVGLGVLGVLCGTTGCQTLLGLDQTTFEPQDGSVRDAQDIDAPSVCDATPICTSSTGRSVCGQLYTVGGTNLPLRAASPTGATCAAATDTGPCALTVTGHALADLYMPLGPAGTAGVIDDCGHYAVVDLPADGTDVGIVVASGAGDHAQAVSPVLGRMKAAGVDRDVRAYALPTATVVAWAAEMAPAAPTRMLAITEGFLVTYLRGGAPIDQKHVARNAESPLDGPLESTMSPTVVGNAPWAGYFSDVAFGTLDPANVGPGGTGTQVNGTAFADLGASVTKVAGVGRSNRCDVALQRVPNSFVFITLAGC